VCKLNISGEYYLLRNLDCKLVKNYATLENRVNAISFVFFVASRNLFLSFSLSFCFWRQPILTSMKKSPVLSHFLYEHLLFDSPCPCLSVALVMPPRWRHRISLYLRKERRRRKTLLWFKKRSLDFDGSTDIDRII